MIFFGDVLNKENLKIILDSFDWSFSKINSYSTCPKMFYLTYVLNKEKEENAFAQWGTFCHLIFEKYFKKELEFYELATYYREEYDNFVNVTFPPNRFVNLNEKYYETGNNYFCSFDDLFEDSKILEIEKEFCVKINNKNFVGIIDLVLKKDNDIFIVDHKSRKNFKNKKEKKEYLRQLYLYSYYIKEKYGKFPKKLIFNFFKENIILEEEFKEEDYKESLNWFDSCIDFIYEDVLFSKNINEFFCNYICSVSKHCER